MALTLDPSPNLYVLSKSPMYLGLETDKYVVNPGVKSVLILQTDPDLSLNIAGNTFNFIWPDGNVTVTLVAGTPDDSGTQAPIWVLGQSAAYYLGVLVAHFKLNYLLSEFFNITVEAGPYILFVAKNYGEELDMVDSTVTGTSFSTDIPDPPEDYQVQANYKMMVDVYVETSHKNAVYEKVGTQELDPDALNMCIFDISEMVNAKLQYALPSFNEGVHQRNTQTMKRFYVRYAEKYGSPVLVKQVYETTPVEALKAGFNFVQASTISNQINGHYLVKQIFLTRQPRTKKVSAAQQEYLHWISPDTSAATVVMYVKLYFVDGSASVQSTGPGAAVGKKELFRFPAGFDQWVAGIYPLVPFSTVSKYEVWMEISYNGVLYNIASEVFTYICDKDSYRDERYFLFTNSDGGIDTFRATGLKIETTEVEGDVLNINTAQTIGYSPSTGEITQANKLIKATVVQNTGFLTRAQNKWLSDFFAAEKQWEIVDGKFIPIVITTKQKPFDESQAKPFAFDFEYGYAFEDVVIKSEEL